MKKLINSKFYILNSKTGFTLIELLVVIFIIGTLTAIILPNFVGSRQRARDARRKQDLMDIRNALRMYYNDNQAYPGGGELYNDTVLTVDYITNVPMDPQGSQYDYCVSDDTNMFVLMAYLENPGDADGVENQEDSGCSPDICAINCEGDQKCYYVCGN